MCHFIIVQLPATLDPTTCVTREQKRPTTLSKETYYSVKRDLQRSIQQVDGLLGLSLLGVEQLCLCVCICMCVYVCVYVCVYTTMYICIDDIYTHSHGADMPQKSQFSGE
jgi:hypothetical protein